MSRQIPWPRIFAEGIAIVVSILLAFGIQAWWEAYQDWGDEQATLVRVHDELVAERERVLLFEGLHGETASTSLSFVGLIDELGGVPGTIRVPDRQLARLIHTPSWETETPSLDGLLQSGGIEMIGDADVRAAIARWDSRVQDTRSSEDAAGQFVSTQLLPALISRADIGNLLLDAIRRVQVAELSADGVTTLRVDSELKALIARRYTLSALARVGLEQSRSSLDNAVTAIGTALGR